MCRNGNVLYMCTAVALQESGGPCPSRRMCGCLGGGGGACMAVFLVVAVICLVNSVNDRDFSLPGSVKCDSS